MQQWVVRCDEIGCLKRSVIVAAAIAVNATAAASSAAVIYRLATVNQS
jgi:hypothetical protein